MGIEIVPVDERPNAAVLLSTEPRRLELRQHRSDTQHYVNDYLSDGELMRVDAGSGCGVCSG
jgi:hypothetical protein